MKKKLLITFLIVTALVCLLAISVSASEKYDYKYTFGEKIDITHHIRFNYTNGENQVYVSSTVKDEVTVTYLDENGNKLTSVPMWEYDEEDGRYYGLVWYIVDQEFTYDLVDQYTWANANGSWGNKYDTEGDKRPKYKTATYTIKSARAVDLTYDYTYESKSFSYNGSNLGEAAKWSWSRNGAKDGDKNVTYKLIRRIYLDEEKTIKLQAPDYGKHTEILDAGYLGYEEQSKVIGDRIVAANFKDLDFQGNYYHWNYACTWSFVSNLQCVWYPDTVLFIETGFGSSIREVEFDGVEAIVSAVFNGCKQLKDFRVPPKCEYLANEMFRGSGLKTIRYGESLKVVGYTPVKETSVKTYYLTTNVLSDSYVTLFTKEEWGYGSLSIKKNATVYFVGDKTEAEALWAKCANENSNYTEVYYYDYNDTTERESDTGMAIFYNYNKCDAFYNGDHEIKPIEGNTCQGECENCYEKSLLENPQHVSVWIFNNGNGVSLLAEIKAECKCTFCDTVVDKKEIPAIFENYGSSSSMTDVGVHQKTKVNEKALADYAKLTGNENVYNYGIFAGVAVDKDGTEYDGNLVSVNGTAVSATNPEKSVVASFANTDYTILTIKIAGVTAGDQIYFGTFATVGNNVTYVTGNTEGNKAEAQTVA